MRTLIGVLIWSLLLGGGAALGVRFRDSEAVRPAARLIRFATEPAPVVAVTFRESVPATPGAPVLRRDPERFLRRVGRVLTVESAGGGAGTRLTIALYPEAIHAWRGGATATWFTVPGSAAWIARTLLPPERVQELRALWRAFFAREREAIAARLWPVVRESLQALSAFYEVEIRRVVAEHRGQLETLIARHRRGAFESKLLPAIQEVAWQVARRRFTPLIEEIAGELWARLPLWSLGWRFAWERVPFTADDHVARRFREFVEEQAAPVLKARAAKLLAELGKVAQETLRDERVAVTLREVVGEVVEDPELLALLRNLAVELTVGNDRLRALLKDRWEESWRLAVADVGDRLQPLVDDVVDAIAMSPDRSRLNGRLAQVLRSSVLRKESAWLLLEPAGDATALAAGATLAGRLDDGR